MKSQVVPQKRKAKADVAQLDPRALEIYCWRIEQLERAGYTGALAQALAEDTAVDLHLACDLLQRGCPEHTAYLILS
jgi:hypothetical protein